jgi:hypothetical protein
MGFLEICGRCQAHWQRLSDLKLSAKFQDRHVAKDDPFAAAPSVPAKRRTDETH